MNIQRAREILPFLQAFVDGKPIQVKRKYPEPGDPNEWHDLQDFVAYDGMDYRIKPVPREWHVIVLNGEIFLSSDHHPDDGELIKVREVINE